MSISLLPISVAEYVPHDLHGPGRVWDQTNCSVDVWVEMLHALGLDPLAAAAFSVAADFEGDQWTFYKYPPEDVLALYGIDAHEMMPWLGVLEHVCSQLERGRLMTVEVDSWFLPDTQGVSYRRGHDKSTIVVNAIDRERRWMAYFHNAGYHELAGDDFDGVFRLGAHADASSLPPYTEIVRLEKMHLLDPEELTARSLGLLTKHLTLRPLDNPVQRMTARISEDADWLRAADSQTFHSYAFATMRQCGASSETASSYCRWLAPRAPQHRAALNAAAEHWCGLAEGAKIAQLKLARLARGRATTLDESWQEMARHWTAAQHELDALASR